MDELSDMEQSVAARTSYAFWAWEQLHSGASTCPSSTQPSNKQSVSMENSTDEVRIRMAMREARRHLVGQDGDFASGLERFKNAILWRKVSAEMFGCWKDLLAPSRLKK